jgi:recombinational DNA repair protein (RecF pathway)
MHHIYHTEAFILKGLPHGEDSKTLVLYTRELGLVYARAHGVRKLSSKLRYVLQDYARVQVDVVRGKEIWRLTTAAPGAMLSFDPANEAIVARVCQLVARLCGQEANEEVFTALVRLYELTSRPLTRDDAKTVELLSVARILIALGYLSRDLLRASDDATLSLFSDVGYQHRLVRDINMALASSHL